MDITEVHGWRAYSLKLCEREGGFVFAGQYGKHLHSIHSSAATCRGYNFAAASWTSEEPREHSDWEIPFNPCSCGFYGYTKLPSMTNVYLAHVTALGRTIIHQNGWRAAKYQLDYFLSPFFSEITFEGATLNSADVLEEVLGYIDIPTPVFEFGDPKACKRCTAKTLELQKNEKEPTLIGNPLVELLSIPKTLLTA